MVGLKEYEDVKAKELVTALEADTAKDAEIILFEP